MQINELKNLSLANANNQINQQISQSGNIGNDEEVKKGAPLRSISLKNPFYEKNDLNQSNAAEEFSKAEGSGLSTKELKNQMVLNSENMTSKEHDTLKENGYDPMDMDEKEFVTIADKIRVQLAKGGMDISVTGGLSDAAAEAIGGDNLATKNIEHAVAGAEDNGMETMSAHFDECLSISEESIDSTMEKALDNAFSMVESIDSSEIDKHSSK